MRPGTEWMLPGTVICIPGRREDGRDAWWFRRAGARWITLGRGATLAKAVRNAGRSRS